MKCGMVCEDGEQEMAHVQVCNRVADMVGRLDDP